jgi:hypothetical protein
MPSGYVEFGICTLGIQTLRVLFATHSYPELRVCLVFVYVACVELNRKP